MHDRPDVMGSQRDREVAEKALRPEVEGAKAGRKRRERPEVEQILPTYVDYERMLFVLYRKVPPTHIHIYIHI